MPPARPDRRLPACLLACAAASLLHHVHNAEFLREYPNLPASLTRGGVYAAWLGEAAIGAAGYLLFRSRYGKVGLGLIGIYALIGFSGLAHYYVAPLSDHTWTMNATIWLEAVSGAALLIAVLRKVFS